MSLSDDLLGWYDRDRRRLPWRESPSPYRTWISEIMLQQTPVATVVPYYERFLERFPDLRALAKAKPEQVLRAWAGLGYYSRARNLHEAAKSLVAEGGARVPGTLEGLLALPGIGRYTAGAILSIAFGKPAPLLDGNVARVFSRLFAIRGDIKSTAVQRRLWGLAEKLVDGRRPGDWNQALMELGALVCVPESPRCGECPVSRRCQAFARGLQETLPKAGAKRAMIRLGWTCLLIEDRGRVLLWKRSENERFLPGHWGLPEVRHLGRRAAAGERLGLVTHSITHHRIRLEVRCAELGPGRLPPGAAWAPRAAVPERLVSSLWRKAFHNASRTRNSSRGSALSE